MVFEEEIAEMFSEISNEVIEFTSTWNLKRSNNLIDKQTETDPEPNKNDKSISTNECKDMAIQAEPYLNASSLPLTASSSSINDRKLADWLKTIYPLIEKELKDGPTNVCDIFNSDDVNDLNIYGCQTLIINNVEKEYSTMDHLTHGSAIWLSLSIQNAPILVVTGSPIHDSWCQHLNSRIYIFVPIRNKELNSIIYKELQSIQVKSCMQTLSTNPYDKDMFAGGTISGDLYVWSYEIGTNRMETINELYSETSQYGSIVGIIWLKNMNTNNSIKIQLKNKYNYEILTCHIDGIIILWKIGKQIVKDKIFRLKSLNDAEKNLIPSTIIGINNNNNNNNDDNTGTEFIVGTEEGNILLCTTKQNLPYSGIDRNIYDPVLSELESHKFPVVTLQTIMRNNNEKSVLISCDISGEILFHYTDAIGATNEPWQTIKIPLPFKNRIVCTKDLRHIITPSINGCLDIFKINTSIKKVINGNLRGLGNCIALSDNECWLVTGCYKGHFQIYKIES